MQFRGGESEKLAAEQAELLLSALYLTASLPSLDRNLFARR